MAIKERTEGDNLLKINFLLIANGDCIFSHHRLLPSSLCPFLSEASANPARWADDEGKSFQTLMSQSFHNSTVCSLNLDADRIVNGIEFFAYNHKQLSNIGGVRQNNKFGLRKEQKKINPRNEERKVQG